MHGKSSGSSDRLQTAGVAREPVTCAAGNELLGPPLCRIYERSAAGPLPPNAPGRRSRFSPAARQGCSAGGCAGSAGRRPSSTIGRKLRAPCRACSRGASAPLFDPLRHGPVVGWQRFMMTGSQAHATAPVSYRCRSSFRSHCCASRCQACAIVIRTDQSSSDFTVSARRRHSAAWPRNNL